MKKVVIALDVGGTTVTAALVTRESKIVSLAPAIKSRSGSKADVIIEQFRSIVATQATEAAEHQHVPEAIGIGMPGPFDYEHGISLMKHKFRSLYKVNVKDLLEKALSLPVYFINDADAFALGAWREEHSDEPRFLGITLGTGLGSGFVVDGMVATEGTGVPPDGEIWNFLYQGGNLEEVVTRHGLERAYVAQGGQSDTKVCEIAERARAGEARAKTVFDQLANVLGNGLAVAVGDFHPTHIAFGGQISKSADLFLDGAARAYASATSEDIPFASLPDKPLALIGASQHAFTQLQ